MRRDRSKRKAKRAAEAEAYAKDARYWRGLRTAERLGNDKPVDRLAAKDLKHKRRSK